MVKIVDGARAVDDIMAKMAGDAAQQRQVIEQVRATVGRVDQTSEQQALLANAAAAAESMRQQVRELIAAVSVFRLSGGESEQPRLGEATTPLLDARGRYSHPNAASAREIRR
jgi:methyl-accepting chemotaxis protein